MSNSVDPDETAHMSRLIWIYAVCKCILLSPVAVKALIGYADFILMRPVDVYDLWVAPTAMQE